MPNPISHTNDSKKRRRRKHDDHDDDDVVISQHNKQKKATGNHNKKKAKTDDALTKITQYFLPIEKRGLLSSATTTKVLAPHHKHQILKSSNDKPATTTTTTTTNVVTPTQKPESKQRILYGVGGVSGSGKSYFISTHEELKDLPRLDIADDYTNMKKQKGHHCRQEFGLFKPKYNIARNNFLHRLENTIISNRTTNIVVELACSTRQRRQVEDLCRKYGIPVKWIWVYALRGRCQKRVLRDDRDDDDRRTARLKWIEDAPDESFKPQGQPFQNVKSFQNDVPLC
jgi:predicted kinase